MKNKLRIFITGLGMGAADLVPGVSGGTIAFIFGIYEELIQSIKTVTGRSLQLLFKGQMKEAVRSVPFGFLIPLGIGILTAIISLSHLIAYLLAEQPIYLWSFFFGLVIASIFIVGRRVVNWDAHDVLATVASAFGAYLLVGIVPVETPTNLLWFFGSGAIAIIAMILPGISGSFILVILGKYGQVLEAVNNRDLLPLIAVAAGCALGIALFSRALSWLFTHHHDITIAVLTGFLIGSLRKIWPWKVPVLTTTDRHGEIVPILEENILPQINTELAVAVGLMIFGTTLMWFFEKIQATKHHVDDINDKAYEKKHKQAVKAEQHEQI
ncbi:MAG: DUF368 domain-containing protein [Patescibacteria group bacterium]